MNSISKSGLVLSFLIATLGYTSTTLADDANMGGFGNTLKVIDSQDIEMESEIINMDIYPGKSFNFNMEIDTTDDKFSGYTEIDVTFNFKNTTDKEVKVKLGFPEKCDYECRDENTYIKLNNFKTFISGKETPTTFQKSPEDEATNWYLFETTFNPNEKKQIKNTYWISPSAYKSGARWYNYILETGASWKNSIGKIDVYARFHDNLSIYDVDLVTPGGYIFNKKENSLEWHITDLEPTSSDNININLTDPNDESFSCMANADESIKTASSSLESSENFSYQPCKAIDNRVDTAWVEGKEDDGINEWLEIPLGARTYEKIEILNGYSTKKLIWVENNRVKKANISFPNGFTQTINLADTSDWQTINLTKPVKISPEDGYDTTARFTILEIYPGNKYRDTALSEIRFLGLIEDGTFPDIQGHKFQKAIEYLKNKGIVNGKEDGTYDPDAPINRAEITKIITIAAHPEQASDSTDCFDDVKKEWFAEYVCYAKEHKIVNGYPDGKFRPLANINYVEALKIALESFNLPAIGKNEPWYQGYLDRAAYLKIGLEDTKVDEKISRGKMAELVMRLLKYHYSNF